MAVCRCGENRSREKEHNFPSGNQRSLTSLVRIYRRKSDLLDYLQCFEALNSLDDAIRYACLGISSVGRFLF